MSFSDQQLAVINSDTKKLSVFATAGSGKTHTMVAKVKRYIDLGMSPRNIAVITFTNEAADNLIGRLEKSGCEIDGLTTKTLHSFCYNLLKIIYNFSGRSVMPKILQSPDAFLGHYWKLVGVYDKKEEGSYSGSRMPHKSWKEYYKFINDFAMNKHTPESLIKDMFSLTPDSFRKKFLEKETHMGRDAWNILWFLEYETWKKATKQIDFNDMLLITLRELAVAPAKTIEFIKNKYRTILVDESQDTNALVVDVLNYITDKNTDVILCGDLRQSIFGFIGASPSTILNYAKNERFESLSLNTNYRSSAEIVENGNHFIANYPEVNVGGDAIAHKPKNGFPICSIVSEDEVEEIHQVTALIQQQLDAGYKFKDICVMYRTNAQAVMVVNWCVENNIPFSIKKDSASIFDRSEMKDILAYLKIFNESDKTKFEDFKRIMNKPLRYMSGKSLEGASRKGANELGFGTDLFTRKHSDRKLQEFSDNLYAHVRACKGIPFCDQIDYIMHNVGYETWWEASEEKDQFFDLRIYTNALKSIAEKHSTYREMIKHINDIRKTIKEKNTDDGIQFTTIHSSKGLEWPVCIVLGVCRRLYPFYRAVEELGAAGFNEEARLFYVASTRPSERLFYSEIHGMYGKYKAEVSPFAMQSMRQIIQGVY